MTAPLHGPTPTLVGRDREQATLRDALDSALAGHGSLVLIGGEAGLGKTALAEAALAEAQGQGALVLIGRCYDLTETAPYGPWREAFARAPGGEALPELPAAVLPQGRDGAVLASGEAISQRVRDYLAALAAARPVVLLLDDLHWADSASLDLLRHLARDLADLPLLVLATFRADEVTRAHLLAQLQPLLVREAHAERLDLRPLDRSAIDALLAARYTLPGADAARLAEYLAGRSEGNALFLGELLRTLEGGEGLHRAGEAWAVGDLVGLPVPTLLRQVIDGRLRRLPQATGWLLGVAAVVGQAVPLAVWAAVAEEDEDALLDHAERAIEARLLAEMPDGTAVRFAHALIREALYEGIPAIRRRTWHRRAAEAILAAPDADPDAVAFHLQRASDPRAAGWLIHAGERAWRAYAWHSAAERYEAALRLLERRAGTERERAVLLMTLAQLRRYDDLDRALAYLDEAARLATSAGDAILEAAATFDRGHLRCLRGDFTRGLTDMERALPRLDTLTVAERAHLPAFAILRLAPEEDHYRSVLMQQLAMIGRLADALRLAVPFAARAPGTTARALSALCHVYAPLGRPDEARRAIADCRAAYAAAGQHVEVYFHFGQELMEVTLPYHADQPQWRRHLLAEAERAWARVGGATVGVPRRLVGWLVLVLEGQWEEAEQLLLARRETIGTAGRRRDLQEYTIGLGTLARARGDLDRARQFLHEVLPPRPPVPTGETVFVDTVELLRLAATLALDVGDPDAARAWLAEHDRWLAWSGAVLGRAENALGWAAYHRDSGDHALACDQAERALAHATDPRQPLAQLAARRLLGELSTAAGRHADANGHLTAALALAEACAVPYEHALTLLVLAELHLAIGDRPQATITLAEARALLEPLEARPALARADALADALAAPAPATPAALPFGLTAREADVLRLLAEGLTDAQIAERLFVGRSTVNTHTRAIYGKLGVTSRAAATRLALDHGLR